MRPVLVDINHSLPPRQHADAAAVPLRWRLLATLPLINVITGFVVQALTTDKAAPAPEFDFTDRRRGRHDDLAGADDPALEVDPAPDRRPAEGDRAGRARATTTPPSRSPPATSWASSRPRSTRWSPGCAERERIREAFGTYLDEEVAEYILSEGFSEDGEGVDVSILFCDVNDFTGFAAKADGAGGRRLPERALRGRRPGGLRARRPRRQVRGRRAARRLRRPERRCPTTPIGRVRRGDRDRRPAGQPRGRRARATSRSASGSTAAASSPARSAAAAGSTSASSATPSTSRPGSRPRPARSATTC